jgi:fumarate reductase subunit D
MLHRLSGLALALFLPVHLYVLSMALTRPEMLDGLLSFADNPLVKIAEFGLVFLLGVHLFGGLRLLALEFLPWSGRQKSAAAAAVACAFVVSGSFLLRAV